MRIVALERKDKTVNQILKAAFPGYKGNRVSAEITDTVRFHGTLWDDGNKFDYVVLRLEDMRVWSVQDAPWAARSQVHEESHSIPPGFVVVRLNHFRGRESVAIMSPAANVTPLLPQEAELSEDEKTVLAATIGLKSSYGGIKDYRFSEAARQTGITRDRWDKAKSDLIENKFLNKAGAITAKGRNAIGGYRLR